MTKKVLFYGVGIIAVAYLSIGVVFYLQDAKYSRGVYVCSGGETQSAQEEDCAPQPISLAKDWPTALTMTIGWLPLIVAQGIVGDGQAPGKEVPFIDPKSIGSFAECAAAGYSIMESYPARCRVTETGKHFTQIIDTPITPPAPPLISDKECVIGGCSNQICSDASAGDVITTCEFRDIYACYQSAKCERQTTGKCGWTETPSLISCLKNPPQLN